MAQADLGTGKRPDLTPARADNVVLSVRDYAAETLDAQAAALIVEFENQSLAGLVPLAKQFIEHTGRYREIGVVEREAWLVAIATR